MACTSCGSGGCGTKTDSGISGCGSSGSCLTGGCNRLNTYDWLADVAQPMSDPFNIIEVTFKNGSRKGFYANPLHTHAVTGDMVLVEAETGFDIGKIALSGELVKLQMKKKKVREDTIFASVIRKANGRDMDRLLEARSMEYKTMLRAREITRSLKLNMKVGDVEYQGDKRKATFFYTADGRVDFRELIKLFAREFRVKIEMRQIGARQESARLGGIGSCGRELCCSTWLTEFKSVSTAAARYQNLAINQAKLSGQCGRLKCCLNYELDSYMDALESFPDRADRLETEAGVAFLMKTDIFKGLMYYTYKNAKGFSKIYPLPVKRVKEILALNNQGQKPIELKSNSTLLAEIPDVDYADVTGEIELKEDPKRRRRRNRNRNKNKQTNGSDKSSRGKKPEQKTPTPIKNQERKDSKKSSKESVKNTNRNKPQGRNQNRDNNNQNKNRNKSKGQSKPPSTNKDGNKNQSLRGKGGQKEPQTIQNRGEKKGTNQNKGKNPTNKRKNNNQKPRNNQNQKSNSNQKTKKNQNQNQNQKNNSKVGGEKGRQKNQQAKNQQPKKVENKNQPNKRQSNKPKTGNKKPPFKNRFKKRDSKNNSDDNKDKKKE